MDMYKIYFTKLGHLADPIWYKKKSVCWSEDPSQKQPLS